MHILGRLDKYLQSMVAEPTASKAMVVSGLLGFLGAAIMFAGDLLLYAHWGEMPAVSEIVDSLLPGRKAVLLATTEQLHISGVLGPIAADVLPFWRLASIH